MKKYTFSQNIGLINIYEEILNIIKTTPLNELNKSYEKELLINDKVILFYVILDLEISEKCVLIGLYFPIVNKYHSIELSKDLNSKEFNERRNDFIKFFNFLQNKAVVYQTNPLLQELTNLNKTQLEKFNNQVSSKYSFDQNLINSYLTLAPLDPIKLEIDQNLNKFVGPFLITFNGIEFDFFIVNIILFYNSPKSILLSQTPTSSFNNQLNLYDIVLDVEKENPSACIEMCFNKTQQIIEKPFSPFQKDSENLEKREFAFSYQINRCLIHFDLRKFLQTSYLKNLYSNKNFIYLNKLKNKQGMSFENFIPLEFSNIAKPVDYTKFPEGKFVNLYNFNDTYYTHELLFFTKKAMSHINSRFMFFNNFKSKNLTFASSLNLKDSTLGPNYINEALNGYKSVTKRDRINDQNFTKDNLIFLNEFTLAKPLYDQAFEGVNFLSPDKTNQLNLTKKRVVQICGTNINLGFGGLHSSSFLRSEDDVNLGFEVMHEFKELDINLKNEELNELNSNTSKKTKSKKEITFKSQFISETPDTFIFDLDVASFYVVLILRLFKETKSDQAFNLFKQLTDLRTKLKKEKNKLQEIYKILSLSITGQLNLNTSQVYDPLLYFSMTANGQLMILEILLDLEQKKLIQKILSVNTDGFTVEISKNNMNDFKQLISDYETKFEIKFDTFDRIKNILIFNVNNYIIQYSETNEIKSKGFQDGDFEFTKLVLSKFMNNSNKPVIDLNILWESFTDVYDSLFKETKLPPELFSYESRKKDRKIYFFSKNPQSFAGFPIAEQRRYYAESGGVYPITELNFQKDLLKVMDKSEENPIDQIISNIEFSKSSYFKYILYLLKPFLKESSDSLIDVTKFSSVNKDHFFETLINDYPIYKSAKYFNNINVPVIPKRADKVSIKGLSSPKKLDDIQEYNESLLNFKGKDVFKNALYFSAAALAIELNLSFPHVFVLDVDHPDIFFQKNASISNAVVEFINKCDKSDCLIASSAVKQQVNRFKLILKITNLNQIISYKKFQDYLNPIIIKNKLPFALETQASIVGLGSIPWEIIPFYNNILQNKPIIEFTLEDILKIFEDQTLANSNELEKLRYRLIEIRDISPMNFEIIKNNTKDAAIKTMDDFDTNLLENIRHNIQQKYEKKDIELQKWIEHLFLETNLFLNIINETFTSTPNLNLNLQENSKIEKESSDLYLKQNFENDITNIVINNAINYNNPFLLTASKFVWCKGLVRYFNIFIEKLKNEYKFNLRLKKIVYLDQNKKKEIEFQISDDISLLKMDLIDGNQEFELVEVSFSSPCIFKPSEDQRIVTLTINNTWQVLILCFHDSCKTERKYMPIVNELTREFLVRYMFEDTTPFETVDMSILDFLRNH